MSETETPAAGGEELAGVVRLHTPLGVALASLLGGPLAGAAMLGRNQRRVGVKGAGRTVLLGVVGMIVYGFLLWWAPTWALRGVLVVGQVVVMYAVAGVVVSRLLNVLDLSELPESPPVWQAVVFGAVGLVLLGAVICGFGRGEHWLSGDSGMRRVSISASDEVIYWGNDEQGEARSVGQALQDEGFFTGKINRTAILAVDADGERVVSLMGGKDFLEQPKLAEELKKIGLKLKTAVGNRAVVVRALDEGFTEKGRVEVR